MRIHRLRLANFRGVAACEVAFAPSGVTVVQGDNEVGKTSLAEALDLLLEHYDDTRRSAVRAVKPVDRDVGAEVEAELSAGPYRFTYAKRFHKDRYTTLTVHAPSRLHQTGREAHDAVRAMLAETVDEALWRAQRLPQGAGGEQPDLRSQTSLARALDRAASAPAGGEAEAGLYERVTEEYRRYHTATGRQAATVRDAVSAHEEAGHDAELARKQLAEVDADVDRCASLERRLADCRARAASHQARLPALERAWQELSERRTEVDGLRLAAELAASTLVAAKADCAARHRLVADHAAEQAARDELQAQVGRAAPLAAAAGDAHEEADARLRAAQQELRAARHEAARARATYERQRDRLDLELLAERHERVRVAQRQAVEAEATLESTAVDDGLLARIEGAHVEVLRADARLEGEHALVEVESLGGEVEVGGRQVRPGEAATLQATEPLEVRVPGVAAVRVRPGEGVRALAGARDHAARALAACLDEAGARDVEDARAAHRSRGEAQRARDEARDALRRDLRDLTPDLLAGKVARLRDRVGDEDVPADLDRPRRAVEAAEAEVHQRAEAVTDAEQQVRRTAAEREDARREQAELAARLDAAEAAVTQRAEALVAARAAVPDDVLDRRVDTAATAAAGARAQHDHAAAELAAADPQTAEAALVNARAVAARDASELRSLEGDLRETRARLDVRGEQGLADRVAAAEGRVARTGQERERIQARAAAARLLYETMTARRDEARRAYVAPFRERIVALGRVVFGPDLDIELDEDLAITHRTLRGRTVAFDDLSAGAREQLAVIARLACAAITSDDGGVPLILDDALGASDPGRLEAIGAVFALAARDAQVIVLTCMPDRYRHIGPATVVRLD